MGPPPPPKRSVYSYPVVAEILPAANLVRNMVSLPGSRSLTVKPAGRVKLVEITRRPDVAKTVECDGEGPIPGSDKSTGTIGRWS